MKRAKVVLMVLLASSCTDANDALTIVQAQVPEFDEKTGSCKVTEDSSGGERRFDGVLDVGLDKAYGYTLYPLISNNLAPLATTGGIEPNRISITGVEVKIAPPAGVNVPWIPGCGATFDDYGQAMIAPGGRKAIKVNILASCHAQAIREMFLRGELNPSLNEEIKFRLTVRAKGRHGSTDIYSDPFEYPIRLCYGCLQVGFTGPYAEFSFAAAEPKILACENMSENPYMGNRCNVAQDWGPVLCCAQDSKGERMVCPGVAAAKPMP